MQTLITRFPESHFTATLRRLNELYLELDEKIAAWQQAGKLRCLPGCGQCCETFEPHVQPPEAEYVALYLCLEAPDLLDLPVRHGEAKHCIFFDANSGGHCRIYKARPLLCRLFAFSSVKDKKGHTVFRLCSRMPSRGGLRQFTEQEIPATFSVYPPGMQEFSLQVETLAPGGGSTSRPLRQHLSAALDKVRWLEQTCAEQPEPVTL